MTAEEQGESKLNYAVSFCMAQVQLQGEEGSAACGGAVVVLLLAKARQRCLRSRV